MKVRDLFGPRSVASARHRKVQSLGDPVEIVVLALRLASVGLLTTAGWIHLHLWQIGYRHIPSIGPLFLTATISAFVVAAAVLLRPSRLVGLLGIGVLVGILAGLAVSVNVGLLEFMDTLRAPFAVESIAVEVAGAVTLAVWSGADWLQELRSTRALVQEAARASLDADAGPTSTFVGRPHANIEN
jgi:hypothetical protein